MPVTPDSVAEMVVVPAETPVARPLVLIVATPVFDEVHVAWLLTFCVATINASGLATGVSTGTTTISATMNVVRADRAIRVRLYHDDLAARRSYKHA